MTELTEEEAKRLYDSGWWVGVSDRDVTQFQLFQDRLCMPFGEFQMAVERALGRSVWTHEFAHPETLRAEFLGERPAPSFDEIMGLIPADKRILVGFVA